LFPFCLLRGTNCLPHQQSTPSPLWS
jgi:hypothetical protein